jgi:hypothetical protein
MNNCLLPPSEFRVLKANVMSYPVVLFAGA